MTPSEIIASLKDSKATPFDAVRAATTCAADIAAPVVAIVEKAADGAFLLPHQRRLLVRGLHGLAAARDARLWQPLLRLLRRNRAELDSSLGDVLTETLPSILISVFNGDVDGLVAAIKDRSINEYARWGLLGVLARLTFDGAIPRSTTQLVLAGFEAEGWAEAGDAAWEGWQDAIMLLGIAGLAPRVRATWSDGRNPQAEADQRDWEEGLGAARDAPADVQRFVDDRLIPLDDPVAALQRFDDGPACAHGHAAEAPFGALDQDDINWLHGFLAHHGATMTVEALDGFFTALVVSPDVVRPSEYLAEIWGGEGPVYDDIAQAEFLIGLLTRHWNSISQRFANQMPCAPIMADAELLAHDWADGFMRGVSLRMEIWDSRMKHDEQLTTFLGHVLMLAVSPDVAAKEGVTAEERSKMVDSLSLAVHGLYLYWREKPPEPPHVNSATPARRVKVGRNEPCPCGSGKKYKRCCSAATATVH